MSLFRPDSGPLFVGTLMTGAGLKKITVSKPEVDLVELRLDALLRAGIEPEAVLDLLPQRKVPLLLTLRHPSEGGVYHWALGERAALLTALLPDVDAIDLELASLKELSSIRALAQKLKKPLVLSAHSLEKPLTRSQLERCAAAMRQEKPAVAKLAVHLASQADLRALARLLFLYPEQTWAVMGVGPLAPLSRLVLTTLGSLLIYGYLDKPAAPGQPSIKSLKAMLAKNHGP
jgi:3-dehydroquinate dehydratase I